VPGGVGGVFGALDVGLAELVCAFGLGDQLVADGEGDLDGRWGQGGQDQVADGGVDLPRAFRTAYLWSIHAADCRSRYSLRTCCGVRY